MNAHIIQSLQLERARRAAFAPFVMPLRLPLFSQVPGALMLWALLGMLSLPNIAAAEFVFDAKDMRDLSDASPGDSLCATVENTCTLRAAIEEINASSLPESRCGVFDFANRVILSPGTYTLAPGKPAFVIGRDDRDVCVHIEGTRDNQGPHATVINGNSTEGLEGTIEDQRPNRVFFIRPGGRVSLNGVTITQGHDHPWGGGAIINRGDLAIYNSLLTKNSTHGKGGAIYNTGNLWILESTLSDNWSRPNLAYDLDGDGQPDYVSGGAIANVGGSVLFYNVTVSGNLGGLDAKGQSTNNGDAGGGLLNMAGGVIGMNNTTVAYNQTFRGNGSGIYNGPKSTTNIWNTIIANNFHNKDPKNRNDCKGPFGSFGHNLVGDEPFGCTVNRSTGDMIGASFYIDPVTGEEKYTPPIDPLLGGLSQNGGSTPTHALLDGSPAIDAGNPDPAGFGACAETDQRYLPRPKDGPAQGVYDGLPVCDIGAYEYGAPQTSVGDMKITEGDRGTTKDMVFTIHLSYPSVEPISIVYWTVDESATAGTDYQAASGHVLFNPGEVSKSINVKIVGGRGKEPDETFFLNLSLSEGIARVEQGGDPQAIGTILNDD